MAKDRIDEKLTELYNAFAEFKGIGDRTKAIEELAKKISEVGEEQLGAAEERLTALCQSVIDAVKSGTAVPEKIAKASASLDAKATGGVKQLEKAASDIDKNVGNVVEKIEEAVQELRRGATAAGEELGKKLGTIVNAGPLADLTKLNQRLQGIEKKIGNLENSVAEVKQVQDAIVETQKTNAAEQASIKSMLAEVKVMVEKIPTKRGLFG